MMNIYYSIEFKSFLIKFTEDIYISRTYTCDINRVRRPIDICAAVN